MPEVDLIVYSEGREVARVRRPLRSLPDGTPAVTYRRQLWPLIEGSEIHLDPQPPPAPSSPVGPGSRRGRREDGWDDLQGDVIDAPPTARLLVSAGPGTGKTAVACARVAQLIRSRRAQASRIWLISFTRTAVKEMRDRISKALADEGGVDAVKIATLDSHAWALHSGFDNAATISGTHDTNIERVLTMLREDGAVQDYVAQVEHLIIDEAQDIVGLRAALVDALVGALPDTCGVTVFTDEAQAIYGFAEPEVGSKHPGTAPLVEQLRDPGRGFTECALSTVFRTKSAALLHLFTETRATVLSGVAGAQKLRAVRQDVESRADGTLPPNVVEHGLAGRDDVFVLYRRRMDALLASSYLAAAGVEHRLRLPGLPTAVHPWIGAMLFDHLEPKVGRQKFMAVWGERIDGTHLAVTSPDDAWALLVEFAGETETVVSCRRLREVLARAQPPALFTTPDFGTRGPVVGTIHAAKGRESPRVHLMLPAAIGGGELDLDEEARVVFVGATRAREELHVGLVPSGRSEKTRHGRVWRRAKEMGKAQLQVGCTGDVQAGGIASRSLFEDVGMVHAGQSLLRRLDGAPKRALAESIPTAEWCYRIRIEGTAEDLGFFSSLLNQELFEIQRDLGARKGALPRLLPHLNVFGARTVALRPDAPEAALLHEPWSRSGFVLAPLVAGFTMVRLENGRKA